MEIKVKVNDIVEMPKNHPCSKDSKYWKVIELGADARLKCTNCGHIITMKRYDFDTKVVKVIEEK